MKKRLVLSTLIITLLLTACSIPVAKNPEEFRGFFKDDNALYNGFESYEVKRSLASVTNSLKTNGPACLSTSSSGNGMSMVTTPTLRVYKNKTTFYVQNKMDMSPFGPSLEEQPENGMYELVVDIFKKGKNSVRVDFYKGASTESVDKVRAWIEGGNGCLY